MKTYFCCLIQSEYWLFYDAERDLLATVKFLLSIQLRVYKQWSVVSSSVERANVAIFIFLMQRPRSTTTRRLFFFLQAAKLLNYVGAADGKNLLSMFGRYSPIAVVSARRRFLTDVTLWGAANVRDSSTAFLSASLYVSKRGADWDRLCRDVVGRWLVGCHARALWPNGAAYSYYGTVIGNPTPGIQWYNFRPP